MSTNVFGRAPNQVPTNADLGGMAYQDPRYVVITGGNANPTNFGTSNAQILFGNVVGIQNLAATSGNVLTLVAGNFSAGNINMTGATITSGTLSITNTTDAVSPATGALKVAGGIGILGNVHIGGNLYVLGNTVTLSTTDVSIQDSIIELHTFANLAPLTVNDGRDIGVKFHYYDVVDSVAFVGRNNSSGFLEWYAKGTEGAGNIFTGTTYGTIKAGEVLLTNTTTSGSTTTGALRVSGGVGIADGLYVNGTTYLQNASTPNLSVTGASISTLVGANISSSNLRVTGGSIIGGTGAFSTLVATNFSSGNIYQIGGTQSIQSANVQIGTNWGTTSRANLTVANISGALNATAGNISTLSAPNFSSSNIFVSGGYISSLTNLQVTSETVTTGVTTNFSSANIYQSAAGTFVATNFSSGNIYQSAADYLVATNLSSSNLRVTGGSITGGTGAFTTLVATAFSSANIYQSAATTLVATSFSSANIAAIGNLTVGPIPGGTAAGNLIINGNAYINNGAYDFQANSVTPRWYVDAIGMIFGV